MNNSRKSRTKILVVKEPLTAIENSTEEEEVFSEQILEEYHNLKEKCEQVILKIKKRKQQEISAI